MSIEATLATWKLTKQQVTSTEKLFLLSCANRAGETHECWPGIERLSNDTGLDRKTLIKIRHSVIDKKLMEFTGEMRGRTNNIPVMRLTYVNQLDDILNGTTFGIVQNSSPGNSTNIGTRNSTKNGTQNLKEESKIKYINNIVENAQIFSNETQEGEHEQTLTTPLPEIEIFEPTPLPEPITPKTQSQQRSTPIKSDYNNSQTLLTELQSNNPHSIPEQMLIDWNKNRLKKKTPLTITAWNKVNKELTKCSEKGISPTEAFETMVASGWQSLKVEYFDSPKRFASLQGTQGGAFSGWSVDAVMRA